MSSLPKDKNLNNISPKHNHRELGKLLSIFTFDEQIGSGHPIWLEKGNTLKEIIVGYINKLQKKHGVQLVKTPIFGTEELYKISGHLCYYKENIYPPIEIENKNYILRPMTCPHHILLVKQKTLTHKSFPITLAENAMLYRNEYSGGLLGLERVRSMELIDMHSFVLRDQINEEIERFCDLILYLVETFEIELHSIALSVRSKDKPEKFFDDNEIWEYAESKLDEIMLRVLDKKPKYKDIKYEKDIGGAAFYGPKIDFQIKTMSDKIITLSTIQLDFLLAKKFELTYKDIDKNNLYPIIIHVGLIGTLERFIAYLLEKYQGSLPTWLTPVQVSIIPVHNQQHEECSEKLKSILFESSIRSEVDFSNNNMGKKIRNSQIQKIPFQIIIGDEEVNNELKNINYKEYGKQNSEQSTLSEFIEKMKKINDALNTFE